MTAEIRRPVVRGGGSAVGRVSAGRDSAGYEPAGRVACPGESRGEACGPAAPPRDANAADERMRALLLLFDRHYSDVFRFARRSVDESTAEDVTQEVFTRLMRLDDLADREINGSYLLKIASNLIKRRYQRERRFGEIARRASGRHAESASTDRHAGEHEADRADRRNAATALAKLGDREREAVDLIVCRGLSYREAAESMGAKVSDVNNWRYRGVERLRRDGTVGR